MSETPANYRIDGPAGADFRERTLVPGSLSELSEPPEQQPTPEEPKAKEGACEP